MGGVRMRARADLRRRWHSWVALGVIIGLAGGVVVAAAAGARRTDSVVSRHIATHRPPDIVAVPDFSINGNLLDFDRMRDFPSVEEAYDLPLYFDREGNEVLASPALSVFGRANLLEGRLPTDDPHEVTINFLAREQGHAIGDTITLQLAKYGTSIDSEFVDGPSVDVRVVGITAGLGDFASAAEPGINANAAFHAKYGAQAASVDLFAFVLRRGEADLPSFADDVKVMTGGKPVLYVETRNDWRQIERSFHVQAFALWMLAAFLALVVFLVVGQTLARQTSLESDDRAVLVALGMAPRDVVGVHLARGASVGTIAALISIVTAFGLSGLVPFGRPALAEPEPGSVFRLLPISTGALAVFAFIVGVTAVTALLSRAHATRARPSKIAGLISRFTHSAPASVGVRLALEPGKGRTSVPVRSSLGGSTIGIVAIVVALVVSASLQHMVNTPRTFGWAWDATAWSDDLGQIRDQIEATPGVAAVSYGNQNAQVDVEGEVVGIISMDLGPVGPVALDGRTPSAANEVALGRRTLLALGRSIGDEVTVTLQGTSSSREMLIVGTVVLPLESDTSSLGEGAFFTLDGVRTLEPSAPADVAFIRFEPGAAPQGVVERLRSVNGVGDVSLPTEPGIVVDFGRVRGLPALLASVIALLALGTIGHLLVSAVRRRRRDLAILKALGFVRRQVAAAVAWQALTVAVASLIIGIPIGISLGRWIWTLLARYGGFVTEVSTPFLALAGVAAATIILAVMVAAIPARTAARTSPAQALRYE